MQRKANKVSGLLLAAFIFLTGCSLDYYEDKIDISMVPEYETVEEYENWFAENIDYQETGSGMYGPETVLSCGFGECDSLSVTFGYIIETRLGIECRMITSRNRITGNWHAYIYYPSLNLTFDPTFACIYKQINRTVYKGYEIIDDDSVQGWLLMCK